MMKTILLIEDDFDLSKMYREQLKDAGYDVRETQTAQAALDALDEEKFDLIVLDILLPGSNGLAVLHELRSYPDWRTIPVIILSNVRPEALNLKPKQLDDLGVVDYLVKMDVSPQDLTERIDEYL